MSDTVKLLDRLAAKLGDGHDASDYRISQALGVGRATVSKWRVGKGSFGDATALKVAELLDENPGYVLAVAAAERATGEQERKAWTKVAQVVKRSAAAAIVLAAATPALIQQFQVCILCKVMGGARFGRTITAR